MNAGKKINPRAWSFMWIPHGVLEASLSLSNPHPLLSLISVSAAFYLIVLPHSQNNVRSSEDPMSVLYLNQIPR